MHEFRVTTKAPAEAGDGDGSAMEDRQADEAESLERALAGVRSRFGPIYLIVGPPRSCTTVLARLVWEAREIRYFSMEPFERPFHLRLPPEAALDKLTAPIDVGDGDASGGGLLIKELSFQIGPYFPALAALTDAPVVFLVRDPRLTIASRMRMRAAGGDPALFPPAESGWTQLTSQVEHCDRTGCPYVVIEANDLRSRPGAVCRDLFERLGLAFDAERLTWSPVPELDLGLTFGHQRHFCRRALESTSLEPPTEKVPDVSSFPADGGMRRHVVECLALYRALLANPNRLHPGSTGVSRSPDASPGE